MQQAPLPDYLAEVESVEAIGHTLVCKKAKHTLVVYDSPCSRLSKLSRKAKQGISSPEASKD